MRCPHCDCLNAEGEHRCRHCGRRLEGQTTPFPAQRSSALPAPEPEPVPPPSTPDASGRPPRQASLFPGERSKVIPFKPAPAGRASREQITRARRASPSKRAEAGRTNQPALDFRPRASRAQTVHDDAPIAAPGVRLKAALLDAFFISLGIALAAATCRLICGPFPLTGKTAIYCAIAAAVLVPAYHLYWCFAGRDTLGMRCFRLRVLTFDGSAPNWRLRLGRFLAACLSLAALGMGLIWALVDEEGLTWHDQMSKTFPTIQAAD